MKSLSLFALIALILLSPSLSFGEESLSLHLSHLAKDEMAIVARMESLRTATLHLSDDWKSNQTGSIMTKPQLLKELTKMEMTAAERWTILLQNLANINAQDIKPHSEMSTWREELKKLPELQQAVNKKLDQFNSSLKDGILLNLARQIQTGTDSN